MDIRKLPDGINNFAEIRANNYYYVDKTQFIEELIVRCRKQIYITRPNHFGKTLNLNMLKSFFEIGADVNLFDGLYISNNKELCAKYMGKFPVVFLSFGKITGRNFEEAKNQLKQVICEEFKRFNFLELSDNLSDREKESYKYLCKMKDDYLFHLSVQRITELLSKHFNQNVIVLIDDFDTPLEYAYKNDYYKEMSYLINMISQAAFRENDALEFALLTGCLREAKDSYFTEVYYSVYSIFDTLFDNQFGFTDEELQQMLMTYGMEDKYDEIKDWYGNYHFGNKSLFCPRDVIEHLNNLKIKNNSKPINYCVNNHLKAFEIMVKNRTTRYEIDALIKDKAFIKYIKPFLSWDESDKNFNNCWNTLVAKGYLTFIDEEYSSFYELVAPNKMAKEVLKVEVKELFDKYQEN